MEQELEKILINMKDAGCRGEDIRKAKQIYDLGDMDALIRCFRKCRCDLMDELHESQRKVDCLDFLIRQTEKAKKTTI